MPSYSFKKIVDYTPDELESAIKASLQHCGEHGGLDFYILLNGVDAYFEKRNRKRQLETKANPSKVNPPSGASS
jgi:hypothetical protein